MPAIATCDKQEAHAERHKGQHKTAGARRLVGLEQNGRPGEPPVEHQQQQQQQNNLVKNNSTSSNETVIARLDREGAAATPSGPLAGGEPEVRAETNGTAPASRAKGSKSLKSFFMNFAGHHLHLFHNHQQHNQHHEQPTGGRAHEWAEGEPAKQAGEGNNFLVSFAQKCFHLNFSSSSAGGAAPAANSGAARECHSCPVTPLKSSGGGASTTVGPPEPHQAEQKRPRSNGCFLGPDGERKLSAGGRRGGPDAPPAAEAAKRPSVRFVVESPAQTTRTPSEEQHGPRGTTSERQRHFVINKHIKFRQRHQVKFSDCGVQTSGEAAAQPAGPRARESTLVDETLEPFVEDDAERARLVEQLFCLPPPPGGAAGAAEAAQPKVQPAVRGCSTTGGAAAAEEEAAPPPPPDRAEGGGEAGPPQAPRQPMSSGQFRAYGYRLIDYICNYLDTIRQRRVTPINIEPGYLKSLIQPAAPEQGESFPRIMRDFEEHIMCGITHWQHPHFHAYFPAGNAYPSILADMLSDALGCVGFSWAASPAYTELEIIMLDWMGKMIGLPEEFLCLSSSASSSSSGATSGGGGVPATDASEASSGKSRGGGVIQGSASECVLVNMLAARHWAIDKLRRKYPGTGDGVLLTKLIGYCSKEAHSCVEKAAMIGFINMRALETDERHSLRGDTLRRAIEADLAAGLEPFIVCATLGTTSCVSFDNLKELGAVCRDHDDLWLHVDAAYAGSALICPEFKYLIEGIELATSFNMNPNKWMLINFDCSLMWVKDRFKLTRAFVVDPLYLQHSFSDQAIDYRHWGIPLSRRFRALKLWFTIRNYGIEGLQAYIRNHVRLAKLFESLIRQDKRFIITNEVILGLVCFRLVGSNALNQRLLSMLNASGKLHMVPASLKGRYIIRFCVCDQNARPEDIHYAYECISSTASELFELIKAGKERIRAISQQNTIDVSSISLHTQQSASADILGPGGGGDSEQQVPATPPGRAQLRRNSGAVEDTPPAGEPRWPKMLTKQASVCATASQQDKQQQQPQRPVSGTSSANLEDLEQEVPIESPAATGNEFELGQEEEDDEELIDEAFLENLGEEELELEPSGEGSARAADEQRARMSEQLRSIINDSMSPIQRGRLSRASGSVRSSSTARGQPAGPGQAQADEADEAADELVKLADKRNRMSLRYKREFFVRVVSDPRVYRASISGDINAHAASTSSLGPSQRPRQAEGASSNPNSNPNSNSGEAGGESAPPPPPGKRT